MDSATVMSSTFLPFQNPKFSHPCKLSRLPFSFNTFKLTSKKTHKPSPRISIIANSSSNHSNKPPNGPSKEILAKVLKLAVKTVVLTVVAIKLTARFKEKHAKAEPLAPTVENVVVEEEKSTESSENASGSDVKTPLSQLMESNEEFVENLKALLQKKLEVGEDEEALKILGKLVEAQPLEMEWKFLLARLLNELGKPQEARDVFEEILAVNPLSFEALFENALLMDRCGEGNAVIARLERALRIAEDENKTKEARDVKLIMAQIQFLQKNIDEALQSYEELAKEDPKDFRPYFCKGMIYSLLDRNAEAREQFAKYKELSPQKYEVEGFLRTSLSKMKLFGTGNES